MLKQIVILKKLERTRESLNNLINEEKDLYKRSEDLQKDIENIKTDKELEDINTIVEEVEIKKETIQGDKNKLEKEIEDLEKELEDLKNKEPINKEEKRGDDLVVREDYFTKDVNNFYTELRNKLKLRANGQVLPPNESGAELIIPDIVLDRIRKKVGDYSTLYPLVNLVRAGGRVKLILDVDTTEARWVEMRGPIVEEDDSRFTAVEFDGFKVGKIVYIDNSLLEDSFINLDSYLTDRIARSIAKSLDKAILMGNGNEKKEPIGIIPKIPKENLVKSKADYKSLIPLLGIIDTGKDTTGEIIAVLHRQTYYSKLSNLSLHTNYEGKDVVMIPNLVQPNFLGLKVVFNNYMPKDKILFGVFEKYTLVERENTKIEVSPHYRFREDQTAIRGIARYDGKPVYPESFILVDISENENKKEKI